MVKTTAGCFRLLQPRSWLARRNRRRGQGSGRARPRKRPQGLDGDADRRTLFGTGKSEKGVCCFRLADQGRCRLQAGFPGVGEGLLGHSFAALAAAKRFAGDGRTGSIRRNSRRYRGHQLDGRADRRLVRSRRAG